MHPQAGMIRDMKIDGQIVTEEIEYPFWCTKYMTDIIKAVSMSYGSPSRRFVTLNSIPAHFYYYMKNSLKIAPTTSEEILYIIHFAANVHSHLCLLSRSYQGWYEKWFFQRRDLPNASRTEECSKTGELV
jgi:hypothetical protein